MEHEKWFWDRVSTGPCEICNETHGLIDGFCEECRDHPVFIPVPEMIMAYAD